jgi:hypothetical protein
MRALGLAIQPDPVFPSHRISFSAPPRLRAGKFGRGRAVSRSLTPFAVSQAFLSLVLTLARRAAFRAMQNSALRGNPA